MLMCGVAPAPGAFGCGAPKMPKGRSSVILAAPTDHSDRRGANCSGRRAQRDRLLRYNTLPSLMQFSVPLTNLYKELEL